MEESGELVLVQGISRLVEEIKTEAEKILKMKLFVKVYSKGTTVPFWRIGTDEEMYGRIICTIYCETKKREISFLCNFEPSYNTIETKLREFASKSGVQYI